MMETTGSVDSFDIKSELARLPECPGVYIMKNKNGIPIYVGKAVSLKNRVSQYFHKSNNHTERILRMISNIARFEYIVTTTEVEALVLECTLIKKYHPKYNVMMRDGKTYPMIEISMGELFPTVSFTREANNPQSLYFGPYPNVGAAYQVINLLGDLYPTRKCSRKLKKDDCSEKKGCINFEMGKCPGCCRNGITEHDYSDRIDKIINFLRGNSDALLDELKKRMEDAAEKLDFEAAAVLRDRIRSIRLTTQKQRVSFITDKDTDAFAFFEENGKICAEVFFIRDKKINGYDKYITDNSMNHSGGEVISSFIKQIYSDNVFIPGDIIISTEIDDAELIEQWLTERAGKRVHISVPKIGDKKKLIEMIEKNAAIALQQYKENIKRDTDVMHDAVISLTRSLQLETIPDRIEAYDISNMGNTDIVGGMIVFSDGVPDKKSYRRFKIRTLNTQNDYEAMAEMLERRFTDTGEGFSVKPELVLVDGGKGHVRYIRERLTALRVDIPVYGIVKDSKHRTRALTSDTTEINISEDLQLMRFLSSIQDEMHKYAIEYNRKLRSKKISSSSMDNIPGVGEKRKMALYRHFGSMTAIRKASVEELSKADGIDKKTAQAVYSFYHKTI